MSMTKRRYKVLPLFPSPLEEDHLEHHQDRKSDSSHSETDLTSDEEGATTKADQTHPARHRMPIFREREEAHSIELFYDLFFVANLTSFTGVHSIDDPAGTPTIPSSHVNRQMFD